MKYLLVLLLLLSICALAKDKPQRVYQDAVLISSSDHQGTFLAGGATPASSVLIPTHDYDVVIAIGDLAYTALIGRHPLSINTIMGDPIKAAIEGDRIYFMLDGKELKGKIIQKARYKPQESAHP